MSGSFDERRRGSESKWAHDEELRFKVMARRDKLLGQWAAGELALAGAQMEAYAKAVVETQLRGGDNEVLRKIRADFEAKKITISDLVIRRRIEELEKLAGDQIVAEMNK